MCYPVSQLFLPSILSLIVAHSTPVSDDYAKLKSKMYIVYNLRGNKSNPSPSAFQRRDTLVRDPVVDPPVFRSYPCVVPGDICV